jgi:hypothetical protein
MSVFIAFVRYLQITMEWTGTNPAGDYLVAIRSNYCYGKVNSPTGVKSQVRLKPVTPIWEVVGFII